MPWWCCRHGGPWRAPRCWWSGTRSGCRRHVARAEARRARLEARPELGAGRVLSVNGIPHRVRLVEDEPNAQGHRAADPRHRRCGHRRAARRAPPAGTNRPSRSSSVGFGSRHAPSCTGGWPPWRRRWACSRRASRCVTSRHAGAAPRGPGPCRSAGGSSSRPHSSLTQWSCTSWHISGMPTTAARSGRSPGGTPRARTRPGDGSGCPGTELRSALGDEGRPVTHRREPCPAKHWVSRPRRSRPISGMRRWPCPAPWSPCARSWPRSRDDWSSGNPRRRGSGW